VEQVEGIEVEPEEVLLEGEAVPLEVEVVLLGEEVILLGAEEAHQEEAYREDVVVVGFEAQEEKDQFLIVLDLPSRKESEYLL
jgi:hypothetical protein